MCDWHGLRAGQAGSVASQPMQLLRGQPGLWDHIAAAACMAGQTAGNPQPKRACDEAEGEDAEEERCNDAWRLKSQALATRILAINCHLPGGACSISAYTMYSLFHAL